MTLRGGEGGGGGGGPALSVTMTLIFPKIVWTCPLRQFNITQCGIYHIKHMKEKGIVNN